MSARKRALEVLTLCRTRGAWADAALGSRLEGLSSADAALCSRIVYGVIQNETLLDFYLSAYCSQKLERQRGRAYVGRAGEGRGQGTGGGSGERGSAEALP